MADIYDDIEDAIPLPLEEEPIFATTGPVITIPAPQKRAVFGKWIDFIFLGPLNAQESGMYKLSSCM